MKNCVTPQAESQFWRKCQPFVNTTSTFPKQKIRTKQKRLQISTKSVEIGALFTVWMTFLRVLESRKEIAESSLRSAKEKKKQEKKKKKREKKPKSIKWSLSVILSLRCCFSQLNKIIYHFKYTRSGCGMYVCVYFMSFCLLKRKALCICHLLLLQC